MRLIDADALKEYILRAVPNWSEDREIVLDCIANSPTIEERKKGKWQNSGEYPWDKCSVCGHCVNPYEDDYIFCPNCGAYMRGGEK